MATTTVGREVIKTSCMSTTKHATASIVSRRQLYKLKATATEGESGVVRVSCMCTTRHATVEYIFSVSQMLFNIFYTCNEDSEIHDDIFPIWSEQFRIHCNHFCEYFLSNMQLLSLETCREFFSMNCFLIPGEHFVNTWWINF